MLCCIATSKVTCVDLGDVQLLLKWWVLSWTDTLWWIFSIWWCDVTQNSTYYHRESVIGNPDSPCPTQKIWHCIFI